jgi:ribosomal protein L5
MLVLQYYLSSLKEDFLTKFSYTNYLEIISLKKIILRFSLTETSLKNLLPVLTVLFLTTDFKSRVWPQKRFRINLKVKSGVAINCKVDLHKNEKFIFLEKFIFFVKPRMKNFSYTLKTNVINFFIENIYLFKELEKNYEYLQELPKMTVSLVFNSSNHSQIDFFLNFINFYNKNL